MRGKVRARIRTITNDWWIRKSEELQRLAETNSSKEFFYATKRLYGPIFGGCGPIASTGYLRASSLRIP